MAGGTSTASRFGANRASWGVVKSLFFIVAFLLSSVLANRQPITVAAAADLDAALTELGAKYQQQTGRRVRFAFGSSGNLANQILNGAPFDLFFSADESYPRQLIEVGAAEPSSLYVYAVGRLVLWVPNSSTLDIEHRGLNVLLDPAVKKIAIANPQHAPYGRAAQAALRHAGIYEKVADRLVLGENVSQAAQFVESGNAQAGLMALSHVLAPSVKGKGRYWEVPTDLYPPLRQAVVTVSHGASRDEAAEFLAYVKSKEAKADLGRFGFSLPEEKH
jgi:molybdate transport system substrate-binding protein